ncbi:hypothetical protein GW755_02160 [bacterium]|nr:hypothetical protein [bacterium]
MEQKKFNLIPLIVAFVLIGIFIYFLKPNKLSTYARAKFGVKNKVLLYELNKDADYPTNNSNLGNFFIARGISGTAYEDNQKEYYVTIVPHDVTPNTELDFGFKEITPDEFYKTVYSTKQIYFTRTLKLIH